MIRYVVIGLAILIFAVGTVLGVWELAAWFARRRDARREVETKLTRAMEQAAKDTAELKDPDRPIERTKELPNALRSYRDRGRDPK